MHAAMFICTFWSFLSWAFIDVFKGFLFFNEEICLSLSKPMFFLHVSCVNPPHRRLNTGSRKFSKQLSRETRLWVYFESLWNRIFRPVRFCEKFSETVSKGDIFRHPLIRRWETFFCERFLVSLLGRKTVCCHLFSICNHMRPSTIKD